MKSRSVGVFCCLVVSVIVCDILLCSVSVAQVKRQALVIGNSTYQAEGGWGELKNPGRDARDMANILRDLSFDVELRRDLTLDEMENAIADFWWDIESGSLALFYYAGHGNQDRSSGVNYLIPSDSKGFYEPGVSVDSILYLMENSESWANLIILDACRNSGSVPGRGSRVLGTEADELRGFALSQEPQVREPRAGGALIAYATAPGEEAGDGASGGNGIFTAALLKELESPGDDILEVLERTNNAVKKVTDYGQRPWFSSSLGEEVVLRSESPRHCLGILKAPSGAVGSLGRVLWDSEILEPVLIQAEAGGYRFQSCASGEPISGWAKQVELFESALVARFHHKAVGAMLLYSPGGAGYSSEDEAEIILGHAGRILEARRVRGGYVKVVASTSIGVVRKSVDVLIIASRRALEGMELEVWDEPWGSRPGDSKIGRKIKWWQLDDSGGLIVHPAVGSFSDLARLPTDSGYSASPWKVVVEQHSEALLSQYSYKLMVVDTVDDIAIAEALVPAPGVASRATFDVATLGNFQKTTRWSKSDFERLERVVKDEAGVVRYWLLGRLFDLPALLPQRIAGIIRYPVGDPRDPFLSEELILSSQTSEFQIANAFYRDQAVDIGRRAKFLSCLMADGTHGASEISEILREGIDLLDLPYRSLREPASVSEAFKVLFHGLDLPLQHQIANKIFMNRVRFQDPDLLKVVVDLQLSLEDLSLEEQESCDIVSVSDSVLDGNERPKIFSSASVFGIDDLPDPLSPAARRYRTALEARKEVRIALDQVLEARGARHTREMMQKGYKALDQGNRFLIESEYGRDQVALRKAVGFFEKAAEVFLKASELANIEKEKSIRIKPF